MDKTEALFIRACKSKQPFTRVQSVYRRFYYAGKGDNSPHIVSILTRISEKYCPMSLSTFITSMNPDNKWLYGDESMSYYETVLSIMINHIRYTPVDKFPGLPQPLRFKD